MVASSKDIAVIAGIGILGLIISKAGKDLFNALPDLDAGLRESIDSIQSSVDSSIKGIQDNVSSFVVDTQTNIDKIGSDAQTNFQNFVQDSQSNLDSFSKSITDLFKSQSTIEAENIFASQLAEKQQASIEAGFSSVDEFEKATDPNADLNKFQPPSEKPFTGKESDRSLFDAGLIDQFGRPITQAEQKTTSEPSGFVIPSDSLEVELPTEQKFEGGGVSFIGGTIRENPVDTLSEVLNLFPELSASQAADFLNEFSGISPTDALRIDPDVSNIVANIGGENIQVPNVSISALEIEENKASCTTCELFGLNCDKCKVERLANA